MVLQGAMWVLLGLTAGPHMYLLGQHILDSQKISHTCRCRRGVLKALTPLWGYLPSWQDESITCIVTAPGNTWSPFPTVPKAWLAVTMLCDSSLAARMQVKKMAKYLGSVPVNESFLALS